MLEVELIANYLIENSYVSSERDAYEFIPCMSDEWLSLVLEEVLNEETFTLYDVISEMRKEDKVKGKQPTPMHIEVKGKSKMVKTPEGGWVKNTPTHRAVNPATVPGRDAQGMPFDPEKAHPKFRDYLIDRKLRRHPHGNKQIGVPEGELRGKKKERGAPISQPESPVAKYKRLKAIKKADNELRQSRSSRFGYGRYGVGSSW
jgi:hypothetical protein